MNTYYPDAWVVATSQRIEAVVASHAVAPQPLILFIAGLNITDAGYATGRAFVQSGLFRLTAVPSWVYLFGSDPTPTQATPKRNLVEQIIAFEGGDMEEDEVIEFFQELIDTGMVWVFHGFYGRAACDLIAAGLCVASTDEARFYSAQRARWAQGTYA